MLNNYSRRSELLKSLQEEYKKIREEIPSNIERDSVSSWLASVLTFSSNLSEAMAPFGFYNPETGERAERIRLEFNFFYLNLQSLLKRTRRMLDAGRARARDLNDILDNLDYLVSLAIQYLKAIENDQEVAEKATWADVEKVKTSPITYGEVSEIGES
ncbi:MAG: hypothetical protein DRO00_05040 [Thermoproteota archaeon]|nr:MAG: hypothetical protein DRO00_05040 [Candidatus Korarchaeota archaeon]